MTDAALTKKRAAQLFHDIYAADRRLQVVDQSAIGPLVDAAVTFNMEGAVVFQGAQLFDLLVARRVPVDALVDALVVLEGRAAKIGVQVRQPRDVQRLTFDQKAALIKKAPPSRSQFLAELDEKRTPDVIKDVKKSGARRKVVWAAGVVVAVLAAIGAVLSIPKPLDKAHVDFSAAAVPCVDERASNGRLFCTVDENAVGNESDDVIRLRMKRAEDEAKPAGFTSVAFLKARGNDGEQHRFRPWLWERDPVKKGAKAPNTVPPRDPRLPIPGAPPATSPPAPTTPPPPDSTTTPTPIAPPTPITPPTPTPIPTTPTPIPTTPTPDPTTTP